MNNDVIIYIIEAEAAMLDLINRIILWVFVVSACSLTAVAQVADQCVWKPTPGEYKLQTLATDEDGAVGKSEVIEVIIERP
jgi:hypothetical protein